MRSRWLRTTGAALLAVPLVLLLGAAPAGAGLVDDVCGPAPASDAADGLVAGHNGSFLGEGVLNFTGNEQGIARALLPGGVAKFDVTYQNNDNEPQDIVVRADFDGQLPAGFVVKALRSTNGKDVTNKVFGLQGLRFRDKESGIRTPVLVLRLKMLPNASSSASAEVFVTGHYGAASVCGDTVVTFAGAP
jgi:hypothetical protein